MGYFNSLKKQEKELAGPNGEIKKKKRLQVSRRYRVSTFYQPTVTSSCVPAKVLDGEHLGQKKGWENEKFEGSHKKNGVLELWGALNFESAVITNPIPQLYCFIINKMPYS